MLFLYPSISIWKSLKKYFCISSLIIFPLLSFQSVFTFISVGNLCTSPHPHPHTVDICGASLHSICLLPSPSFVSVIFNQLKTCTCTFVAWRPQKRRRRAEEQRKCVTGPKPDKGVGNTDCQQSVYTHAQKQKQKAHKLELEWGEGATQGTTPEAF